MRRSTALLCFFLLALAQQAAGQGGGFQPRDYYRVVGVSEVAMSPTGDYVAFTVTRVVEEDNARRRAIWLQPLGRDQAQHLPYRLDSDFRVLY